MGMHGVCWAQPHTCTSGTRCIKYASLGTSASTSTGSAGTVVVGEWPWRGEGVSRAQFFKAATAYFTYFKSVLDLFGLVLLMEPSCFNLLVNTQ